MLIWRIYNFQLNDIFCFLFHIILQNYFTFGVYNCQKQQKPFLSSKLLVLLSQEFCKLSIFFKTYKTVLNYTSFSGRQGAENNFSPLNVNPWSLKTIVCFSYDIHEQSASVLMNQWMGVAFCMLDLISFSFWWDSYK